MQLLSGRTQVRALSSTCARAAAMGAIAVVTLSCSSSLGDPPQVAVIEVSPFSSVIDIGAKTVLAASPLDGRGRLVTSGPPVVWSSAPASVATIDAKGQVTGISIGVARITAKRGSQVGTASVTVRIPAPAKVDFPQVGPAISRGDTARIAARATSTTGAVYTGRGFSWHSSNAAVASITPSADSSTALLRAVAPGTAVITATNFGVEGSTTITVSPDPEIAISVATVAFQGTSGGSDPAPQVVKITNAGGGVLRGLAVASVVYNQPSAVGWLRAALSLENAGAQVSLTTSPGGLPVGNYSAKVVISTSSPAVAPQEFNVTFAVAAPPILTLSSPVVSFGASVGGVLPPSQSIDVTNTGGGTLSGLAVSAPMSSGGQPATWLTATLSSTSAPATISFAVNQAGLGIGTYLASVGVSSAGATGSPRTLAVTLVVSQSALIVASPTSVSFAAVLGTSPAPASISITNGGGGSLTGLSLGATQYGAGQPTNWLVATLGAAQAPSQITITPSTSALPVGTYSASFAVQSSLSGVSDATVTVNLTVRSAAAIVLTTTNVTLTASKTSANPSAVVGITNGGSGALAGLSAATTYVVPQGTSWLSTSFAGATTAPTSLTLQPNVASLAVGTYTATVRVSSPSAPAFVDIAVTLNVLGSLKAGSPTLALFGPFGVGTSVAEFTSIANDGIGFIDGLTTSVTYTSGSGWLANRLSQTKTPATFFAEANPAPTAPRGISLATVTIRGNNVLPITVIISREIGYTFERHVVNTTVNVFNTLGCNTCHDGSSATLIPFTDYSYMVSYGYFNPGSRTPTDSWMYSLITGGGHSPTYPAATYPGVALVRDWISDGTRLR